MKPRRVLSLLTGVALLVVIAGFNVMALDVQASFVVSAAELARSLLQSAIATYQDVIGATAQERSARVPARRRATERREGAEGPAHRIVEAEPPAPAGNPLWALPLKQLSITRERPLFSAFRRPPPPTTLTYVAPVAVQQPVKPREPERPAVSLLGTIIGTGDRIGVFLETATQNIIRLRVGEDHQGWVLHLIKAREVTLVRDGTQAVVLELPLPGEAPAPGGTLAGPVGLPGVAILSSANSADEQPGGWRAPRARNR